MAAAKRPKQYCYDFPRPAVTTDVVLFTITPQGDAQVLLIERANEPMKGKWAFPGGFVDESEPLVTGACRELAEETTVTLPTERLRQFGAYGDPKRDPRGWTISIGFYGVVDYDSTQIAPADDAKHVEWQPLHRPPKLAFDHHIMLRDALTRLREDLLLYPVLQPLFGSETFTRDQLTQIVQTLTNEGCDDSFCKNLEQLRVVERIPKSRPARYRYLARC